MLTVENALVLMIDMQEKLVNATNAQNEVKRAKIVLDSAKLLEIPIVVTEQYPKGLGSTINDLAQDNNVFEKTSFPCLLENNIKTAIENSNRKQIILFGIESHICVYQTALNLLDSGYEVYMVKDASASRAKSEYETVLQLMQQAGIKVTTTEIVVFELLKTAKHPKFKEVQALIK